MINHGLRMTTLTGAAANILLEFFEGGFDTPSQKHL